MDQHDWLAERFEGHRIRLRVVAYRMLGSRSEADDAVQETWLRLQGAGTAPEIDHSRQREVVDAFLAASRTGDFDALLAVLDPDVVLRADQAAVQAAASRQAKGGPALSTEVRTAAAVADMFKGLARAAQPASSTGSWAPCGHRADGRAPHSTSRSPTGRSSQSTFTPTPRTYTSSTW